MRYAELMPIDDTTTALRTTPRNWVQVPLPVHQLETLIRSFELPEERCPSAGPDEITRLAGRSIQEFRAELKAFLLDSGGLMTLAERPGAAADADVALSGNPELCLRVQQFDGSGLLRDAAVLDAARPANQPSNPRVVLVPHGQQDLALLRETGRRFAECGQPWAPFGTSEGRGWFGPLFIPGDGPDIVDLIGRQTTNALLRPWLDGRPSTRLGSWTTTPQDAELAWMVSVVAGDLARYAANELPLSHWHQLELDPTTVSVRRHLVLPLPLLDDPGQPPEALNFRCTPDDLIDDRTGIVTRIRTIHHHPSIPRALITVHAHVANMHRITPWYTDPVAAGTSFGSPTHARQAALGEAVERYSGDLVRADLLRFASWQELTAAGEHAVDPEELVLFSPRQYASPGFPFVPLTRELSIHWVRGRSLTLDRVAWLPANLVYANWYTGGFEHTPHFNNPFFPGLAAGPDLEFALAAGIQEVIERHATMVWWANRHPLPSVQLSRKLAGLWSGAPTDSGQRAWLIHLDNEFNVPVMAGVVENTVEKLFTIGFAARPDPEAAGLKAWAEALTLQDGARDLLRPDGGYRQSADRGEVNGAYMKAWRSDRRYLDDFRPDFRDTVDLMSQLQLYLDPRATERIRPWVQTPVTRALEEIPRLPEYSLRAYKQVIENRGYEVFYADVTTRDVACTGMRVVRVLVPGLVPNFAAAFPFHGRGRLCRAAVDLGWREHALDEGQINIFPMPHA